MVGRKMQSQGIGERENHPKWKEGALLFEERLLRFHFKSGSELAVGP